ncbi:DUF2853 family protein [Sphingobacterium faecium]|jgi:hypothetical protein|uniref:DUF2853 family protein n=1 Tax=Sphingobacterium faecium TaxID=34087 RepID=UPI0004E5F92A|nr:DUF2853 family protein [Sphingobacterium faecium]UXD68156.1 DUF2853 family protein [Sphingobacterium faecium]CDT09449.1 conserved hypothetical protein [Sphingobacterium sp. PM2-P1-29]
MSKLDEKITAYIAEAKKLKLPLEDPLIESVTRGLGPSIYKADAETIASSDPDEIKRLKTNFLIKKLGLADDAKLDAAIDEVFTQIGKSNRNKYRVLVYALLVKKFKKESVYK